MADEEKTEDKKESRPNSAKSDKSDKSHKSDKSDKSDKSHKSDKSDKSDKSHKSDKSDKSDKSHKSDKSDKSNKSAKSHKSHKSEKKEDCQENTATEDTTAAEVAAPPQEADVAPPAQCTPPPAAYVPASAAAEEEVTTANATEECAPEPELTQRVATEPESVQKVATEPESVQKVATEPESAPMPVSRSNTILDLTVEEQDRFQALFDMYATESEGETKKLNKNGIKLLFRFMGEIVNEAIVTQWLSEEDKNVDGCLDFEEFCALYKKKRQKEDKRKEELLMSVNQLFPSSNSGDDTISLDKMAGLLKQMNNMPGLCREGTMVLTDSEIDDIIGKINCNNDNTISKSELVNFLSSVE